MSSENDREVLNSIFNPLLPMGEIILDEQIPDELKEDETEEGSEEIEASKTLEMEGVRAAEKGNLDIALEIFNKAIFIAPKRASGYNNRAQTHRLLGNLQEAKDDLNNAINLSGGKGKSGCQAYCQRGLIRLKENQREDAKSDFEMAAKLGSKFAKAQLVQMNPYAALCNKMLKQMFGKLNRGDSDLYDNCDSKLD